MMPLIINVFNVTPVVKTVMEQKKIVLTHKCSGEEFLNLMKMLTITEMLNSNNVLLIIVNHVILKLINVINVWQDIPDIFSIQEKTITK
jgi:hypothetical protein